MFSNWILYFQCDLSSVPWEGCTAAAAASPSPTPGYAFHRGHGKTQVSWHGETYCLLGGYRVFGDAPLATPAKVEAHKPVPKRAPKRHRT
ncbi:hypothetical protein MC885_006957 [Smutsia gigantea]|nr:hypothetical protein MC885_006957 [Smutsia gigantea]